ncbi:MAG: hypothetical protein HKM06_10040, partial [Spirochaetales bacterium]|nr:hypothetical protein [Spirochaetales bacterium]
MKRTFFWGGLLAAFFWIGLPGLSAQDLGSEFDAGTPSTSSSGAASASANSPLVWSGDHLGVYHQPLWGDNWDFNNEALWPQMDNTIGIKYSSGPVKLVVNGTVETVASPNTWSQMSIFKPGETYLSWAPGQFLLNFGYQIYNWGVADKNNPSDGLNARDWAQGWDAPKVPLLSADLRWFPDRHLSLEGVLAPYQTPSQFPVDFQSSTQAGLNTGAAQLSAAGLGTFFPGYTPTASTSLPPNNPNSAVAGARVNYYSSAADLSLSYIYDMDPYPTPVVTMSSYAVPAGALGAGSPATTFWVPGQIQLVNKRIHRFGANVKTTVGPYGLWLE